MRINQRSGRRPSTNLATLLLLLAAPACGDDSGSGGSGTGGDDATGGSGSTTTTGSSASTTSSSSSTGQGGDGGQGGGPLPACGDGTVDPDEACDDGNLTDDDGCDSNCTVTECGNGIVTSGEACDDGNLDDDDGCDSNCTVTACGNGIATSGEDCDDGNAVEGDGCDSNCTASACGNGVAAPAEGCDDGNTVEGDGCDSNCTVTACGKGIITAGEDCDDGDAIDDNVCSNDCYVLQPEALYYKFDGMGTAVPNLAMSPPAGAENATLMGGVTQGGSGGMCSSGSVIGSGLSASTDYVDTAWAPDLGAGSWSISFWASGISVDTTLFYIFGDANAGSFRCFTNGVAGPNNWILRGGGLTDVYVNGGAIATPTMTTFVYDSTANTVYAYLDGVLASTVAQTAPNVTGTGPFKVIGYGTNVGAPAGGLLDEFRVYRRALTSTEVGQLFAATSSCNP
jgi:cysteine-rich repeat protein